LVVPLGFILYKTHERPQFNEVQLLATNLQIKYMFEFTGIGTLLLNEVKKMKIPICLYSDPGAVNFYMKMKFVKVKDRAVYNFFKTLLVDTVLKDEHGKESKPKMFIWELKNEKIVLKKRKKILSPPVKFTEEIPPGFILY